MDVEGYNGSDLQEEALDDNLKVLGCLFGCLKEWIGHEVDNSAVELGVGEEYLAMELGIGIGYVGVELGIGVGYLGVEFGTEVGHL